MTNFNEMGKNELRVACKEFGVKNYGKMNNDGMRAALVAATQPAVEVVEVLEVVVPVVEATPAVKSPKAVKVKKEKVKAEVRNGVKRPGAGGVCAMIWEECDRIYTESGLCPKPAQLLAFAEANSLNANNAKIELYQWRKFSGIVGRVK